MNKIAPFVYLLLVAFCFSCQEDDEFIEENPIFEGDVSFTSQQDLDNFSLQNIVEVTGSVMIGNDRSSSDPISSLANLGKLQRIGGHLKIEQTKSLVKLEGLDGLVSIGRDLIIVSNDSLREINTLRSLEIVGQSNVGGSIEIGGNTALLSLNAFDKVSVLNGSFWLSNNPSLLSMAGFRELECILHDFYMHMNPQLLNINAFQQLSFVGWHLSILGNNSLPNLNWLGSLSEVGLDINIIGNTNLTILGGLNTITRLPGSISISDNSELTSLEGLEELTEVGFLYIAENNRLTDLKFPDLSTIIRSVHILDNDLLTNLNGLSKVNDVGLGVKISNNAQLNDFCGIKPMMSNDFEGDYEVLNNAFNPTLNDLLEGSCN